MDLGRDGASTAAWQQNDLIPMYVPPGSPQVRRLPPKIQLA